MTELQVEEWIFELSVGCFGDEGVGEHRVSKLFYVTRTSRLLARPICLAPCGAWFGREDGHGRSRAPVLSRGCVLPLGRNERAVILD